MQYSKFQVAIFEEMLYGSGHLQVQAYAGSGKSTTQREAVKMMLDANPLLNIGIFAFNKLIATDMQAKLPKQDNITVKTMNGFGWGVITKHFGRVELDKFKTANILQQRVAKDDSEFFRTKNIVTRLVSLFKNHAITDYQVARDLAPKLVEEHGMELRGLDLGQVADLASVTFQIGLETTFAFDFDDQVFMPIALDLRIPTFDRVLIDELQDLSPVQLEMIFRACSKSGRITGVGDEHQAIYAFRGADHKAMETFRTRLNAKQLPLSICYRCPKAVIREAQKIVPGIEWAPDAAEGKVSTISEDDYEEALQPGDWSLCRVTAPLVTWCLRLIRKGRKATIKGKDIGDTVIAMIKDIDKTKGPADFVSKLAAYRFDELEKLSRRQNNEELIAALEERVETIQALIDGMPAQSLVTSFTLIAKVNEIFTDSVAGIVFCTIHKSKGLEAHRIGIIKPELLPHPRAKTPAQKQQEMNLLYVARTRAERELLYVETKEKK